MFTAMIDIQDDDLIGRALAIALTAHTGQTDKGGMPYIMHPLTVATTFTNVYDIATALLHDVIEDSDFTLEELSALGMPPCVVDAVDALTRREGESFKQYIRRCRANDRAARVKATDISHNLDLTRLNDLASRDEVLRKRPMYFQALAMLNEVI